MELNSMVEGLVSGRKKRDPSIYLKIIYYHHHHHHFELKVYYL